MWKPVRRPNAHFTAVVAALLAIAGFAAVLILAPSGGPLLAQPAPEPSSEPPAPAGPPPLAATQAYSTSLPLVLRAYAPPLPFGTEPTRPLTPGPLLDRATELGVRWVRLNDRISWNELQPVEGGDILWESLADLEAELRALKAAGVAPALIVDDYPLWATNGALGGDGLPSHCAPIRPDKLPAFASFLQALAARYKAPEFNVHRWELGNEPDVDPRLVSSTSVFGCWGNIEDPYYGGEGYGAMLVAVVPAVRAEDPRAVVLPGGLLLDNPHTSVPGLGRPELFLEGILRAGAAPYLDAVPYHAYPGYQNLVQDHDLNFGPWTAWGGGVLGKAAFLREIMGRYGVDRPLLLNEAGLTCPEYYTWCVPPDDTFFRVQAAHLARSFVRALSGGIEQISWYTLDGPGWRYTGLLDRSYNPRPAFVAYQALVDRLDQAQYLHPVDGGPGVEAYAFRRGAVQVQAVWSIEDEAHQILVPDAAFLAAYRWDGVPLDPPLAGSDRVVETGFEPVYLILDFGF